MIHDGLARAVLFVSLLGFAAPLAAYHLELEAQPAAVFPYLARFGTIDLQLYDGGVRADTFWLDAFSRDNSANVTVLNPLGRMYTEVPISQLRSILGTLGTLGSVERDAAATVESKVKGKVGGVPATRHRLVYGTAYIDYWTTSAIPENVQLRRIVDELVTAISPGTTAARCFPRTALEKWFTSCSPPRPGMRLNPEGVVDVLDRQKWLDGVSSAAQPVVLKLISSLGPLKDVLHGVWLGHPLHPALTDIPVGAWTAAVVFDAMKMHRAADAAVAVGLAGAAGSAVTGLADWSETAGTGRAQRIGAAHGLMNVAATTLYALSMVQRIRGDRGSGVRLSTAGYAIALASAFLGGHLVFGEQIGVDHTATADSAKPEKFTAVLREEQLEERKPTRVDAQGVAVLLVKQNGRIFALGETCTHLGGPLAEGELDEEGIRCPWHGSRFCLADGTVLGGPATFRERLFDVRVRGGQIEVRARRD